MLGKVSSSGRVCNQDGNVGEKSWVGGRCAQMSAMAALPVLKFALGSQRCGVG